jgi:activator of HSP90 ATPase
MKTKNINYKVLVYAAPKKVYDALMNSKQHSKFTGAPAKIGSKPGKSFTCYGNYISGFTLELRPAKRIVQAWRSKGWPNGHFSIVTFKVSPTAKGQTELHFTQIGVPADDYAAKNKGWRTHYWEPLKKFLEA